MATVKIYERTYRELLVYIAQTSNAFDPRVIRALKSTAGGELDVLCDTPVDISGFKGYYPTLKNDMMITDSHHELDNMVDRCTLFLEYPIKPEEQRKAFFISSLWVLGFITHCWLLHSHLNLKRIETSDLRVLKQFITGDINSWERLATKATQDDLDYIVSIVLQITRQF